MMYAFPAMTIRFPPRAFPNIPAGLEQGMWHMKAKEDPLFDEKLNERWWKPKRSNPGKPPPDFPVHVTVEFAEKIGGPTKYLFAMALPPEYDRQKLQPA
jgi:hypothetical protein